MIEAVIKYSGTFVDKPSIARIQIEDDMVAAEEMMPNGKTRKITAAELYKIFYLKQAYIPTIENNSDEEMLTQHPILPEHFEEWIRLKFLKGRNFYDKIISIDYNIT
jgi:desulfoferrodoxin (superoxide reductase-like protein)